MAIENEIKIQVNSHKSIVDRLKYLNAQFKGTFYQKDCYFDNSGSEIYESGGCLRLRTETDKDGKILKSILCHKGSKLSGKIKSRSEVETTIGEPENLEQILNSLGYSPSISFNKERQIWLLGGCEICLDRLPLIGKYIEIEGKTEQAVLDITQQLNLSADNQQMRSYASLINEALRKDNLKLTEIYLDTGKEKIKQPLSRQESGGKEFACIILNPSSGSGFTYSIGKKLQSYLQSKGLDVRLEHIKEFGDIARIISSSIQRPDCRLIAICGGDGTVREAMDNLAGSRVPLMILPGGTENVLAKELGCDKNIDTYKFLFEKNVIKPFDIGVVNGKCFTSMLGVGFDAEIVELLTKTRSGNITHSDYIWPIWRTFWAHQIPAFTAQADGKEIFTGSGMLFVGNISRYATGLRLLKDADFSDGLLDVCIFPCKGKGDILKYLSMTMLQIHTNASEVVYVKCRKLKVEPLNDVVLTQIDGDPGPQLPLDIEVAAAAVNVYTASNG